MSVIGMNFTSIDAKTENKTVDGNVNVNSTPTIKDVRKKEIPLIGLNNGLAIDFTFKIEYQPKIGEINFSGEVIYKTDKVDNIVKIWKKDKKLA